MVDDKPYRTPCRCGKKVTITAKGQPRTHVCNHPEGPGWPEKQEPTPEQPVVPADVDETTGEQEHVCTYAPGGRGTENRCACGKPVADGPADIPAPGKVTDDPWRMSWTRETGFSFKVNKGSSFRAACGHMIHTHAPYRERPEGGYECRGEWVLAADAPVPSCMIGREDTLDRVPAGEQEDPFSSPTHVHTFTYADDGIGHSGSFCDCGAEEPSSPVLDVDTAAANWNGTGRPRPSASTVKLPPAEPETEKPRLLDTLRKGMEFAEAQDAKGMAGHRDPLDDLFVSPTPEGSGPRRAATAAAVPDPFSAPSKTNALPEGSPTDQPETDRDGWGRYIVKDPRTGDFKRNGRGKPMGFTRATTFGKTLLDQFGIHQWEMRSVIAGLALRPDLLRRAVGLDVAEDKDALNELAMAAKDAAGGNQASSDGTEFHTVTEWLDSGRLDPEDVPEKYKPYAEQYLQQMALAGLTTRPEWIERVTFSDASGEDVAGTLDRIVLERNGQPVIADVKSGKGVDLGQREIAMQLKTYARGVNTYGLYNKATKQWEPWTGPPVSEDYAIILHVPLVRPEGVHPYCDVIRVDLRGVAPYGIDTAMHAAAWTRGWRKERGFLSPYHAPEAVPQEPHPAALPADPEAAPGDSILAQWERSFAAVASPEQANQLWQAAVDAGMDPDTLNGFVALAREALAHVAANAT